MFMPRILGEGGLVHVQLMGNGGRGQRGGASFLGPCIGCCDWSFHVGGIHTFWKYNMKPDSRTGVICKPTQVLLVTTNNRVFIFQTSAISTSVLIVFVLSY